MLKNKQSLNLKKALDTFDEFSYSLTKFIHGHKKHI